MDWKGRRVVMVGAGRQGIATAGYLAAHGARVAITDARPAEQLAAARQRLSAFDLEWSLGGHPSSLLDLAELLVLSGGVPGELPLVQAALARGIPVSNDSQLFLELAPCKVIGITGSAGKTTTTMLVGRILKAMEGKQINRAWVGGNLGNPLLSDVDAMSATDLAVMELSSFQLEWMTRSPHIAAILNLAPNHLDRHASMENYIAAKARILEYQTTDSTAILNIDDAATWMLASRARGRLWAFSGQVLPADTLGAYVRGDAVWLRDEHGEHQVLPCAEIELIGQHNLLNVVAACAVAAAAAAPLEAIQSGVRAFRGAPHRLERVRTVNGVDWYNDSIATAPQRSEAALRSFDQPIVLLLGGRDKGLPWEDLAKLARDRVRQVVFFGEAGGMLSAVFNRLAPELPNALVPDLESAVQSAATAAQPGDLVLLAPGGTSFDEFVDFEARGERFRQLVNQL
ncbi:MAG: UDP-N-acetylmuramoyl-L-alanine--D-glutamate ligase [Anaerolineales bacterium]